MNIVVLDGYTLVRDNLSWHGLAVLGDLVTWERSEAVQVERRIANADIVVVNKTPISSAIIRSAPNLKYVAVMATGYNVVDADAAAERGIPVSNVPNYGTETVAQFTFALLLELCNQVGRHGASVAAGEWETAKDWTYWKSPQVELQGLTLGIVGFGRIGKRVAALGHAFGMRIMYAANHETVPLPFVCERNSIEQIFAKADVVSLHSSLSAGSSRMVDSTMLGYMKQGSFLINTARGQLIDEAALAQALRDGRLAGAALDVLATEPPVAGNSLLSAPNCIITPHIAWSSASARERILETTIQNVRAFIAGNPINVVNGVASPT